MVRGLIGQASLSSAGSWEAVSTTGSAAMFASTAASSLAAGSLLSTAPRGSTPITWANAWANSSNEMPCGCDSNGGSGVGGMDGYFHRLATSACMNRSPSEASCRSLSYMRRQILVAGMSFSKASPNASIISRLP